MPSRITSHRNSRVVRAVKLHKAKGRKATGDILLEGPNIVGAALDAGYGLETVFGTRHDDLIERAATAGAEVALVSDEVLARLATTDQPRGPVAIAQRPVEPPLASVDTVVLCSIQDPGNVGTLIRSAAAFGFQVVATGKSADLWSPKVMRSAAGAHFATPVATDRDLADLADLGIHLVALVPLEDRKADPDESMSPIGLMVGNEARGLSNREIETATATLTVPTSDAVESLNAAVAGSIAMFAIAQGR